MAECERCGVTLSTECLDKFKDGEWRVKKECPVCHMRLFTLVKEGKKEQV
jgi:hypothetical protein